ncbi:MAG: hypothetical protein M0Z80_12750 [Treponema sp.]|nr:hypothetical protein [Treponema sp.]
MFPFTISGSILVPGLDEERLILSVERVRETIAKAGASKISQDKFKLAFRSRWYSSSLRHAPFDMVDSGVIEIIPGEPDKLSYTLSCRLALLCFSLLFVGAAVVAQAINYARAWKQGYYPLVIVTIVYAVTFVTQYISAVSRTRALIEEAIMSH